MSSRSLPIRLSAKARQDFVDILRFTGENWGQGQLTAYRSKIDDALSVISRNPEIGRAAGDLPPSWRLFAVGSHVIVYRIEKARVGVARILHQRMNLASHL